MDSGPRETHGALFEESSIAKIKRGKVLQIVNDGKFEAKSDVRVALIPDFSIVAWIGLKTPESCFHIVMRAYDEDETAGERTVGYAGITVHNTGTVRGWFEETAGERTLANNVYLYSTGVDVTDFKWHYVAFSRFGDIYTLFVDGEVVDRRYIDEHVGFIGDKAHIYLFGHNLQGSVFVDDLMFLEIGLSVYEVRAIKNTGLDAFLQAMPVDPADKVATTWAAVKHQR